LDFKKIKIEKERGKPHPVNGPQAEAGQSAASPWPMVTAWQPATGGEGRWRTDRPCSDRTFKPV
jgi:hypothetical protein